MPTSLQFRSAKARLEGLADEVDTLASSADAQRRATGIDGGSIERLFDDAAVAVSSNANTVAGCLRALAELLESRAQTCDRLTEETRQFNRDSTAWDIQNSKYQAWKRIPVHERNTTVSSPGLKPTAPSGFPDWAEPSLFSRSGVR